MKRTSSRSGLPGRLTTLASLGLFVVLALWACEPDPPTASPPSAPPTFAPVAAAEPVARPVAAPPVERVRTVSSAGDASGGAVPVGAVGAVGEASPATGGFTVRWSTVPHPIPTADRFVIAFEVFTDASCATVLDVAPDLVAVDAAMPHHGHGMNVRPTIERVRPGAYRANGMLFHMAGRWELFFDVTRGGLTERAQTTTEVKVGPT